MAEKTIAEWQAEMIAAKEADPVIGIGGPSELDSTSGTAIWRLITYVVAKSIRNLAALFTFHKEEVQAIIDAEKPHTLQWYVTMAKRYQDGDTLPADSDTYNPVADPGDASLIVTFAAAVELVNLVRIKVATGTVGALAPITGPQLTALRVYMGRVKDAGVRLQVTTGDPDNLQLKVKVYYDPLVMDATGAYLDGSGATPVKDAMNAFLADLPFDGVLEFNKLVEAGQVVRGVKIYEPTVCQANYAATPYINIIAATPNVYVPDAGYLALDEAYFDANVEYIPR